MENHSNMKLGKQAARHDPRTLQLANYLVPAALPTPPSNIDYSSKIKSWPMMANDKIGDCTCAAAGHLIQEWTANVGTSQVLSDSSIIKAYADITGYDPATGLNDNGAVELDVLNYWRKTGIGNHQIQAYVALEPKNASHVQDAIFLFGGCYIGLALPITAQTQDTWSVPPGGASGPGAPGSWGGHAVPVTAYNGRNLTVVTWGAVKLMTWEFWNVYCDEAYALLSPDWINPKGGTPAGFDLATLQQDLRLVVG